MTTLVELQSLTVAFSGRNVLDNVALKLERGEITTLIGLMARENQLLLK